MKAPAARIARPRTRLRDAPPRNDLHADQAAPPTSRSEPPELITAGRTLGTSIAPAGGTCALSKFELVCDASTATTHINEIKAMTITAARPARGVARMTSEPIPSQPTLSSPPNR